MAFDFMSYLTVVTLLRTMVFDSQIMICRVSFVVVVV